MPAPKRSGVASLLRCTLMANRFGMPDLGIGLGLGLSLGTVHYSHVLEHRPAVDWFEVISENYMQTSGRPLDFVDAVSDAYPIVMHGVSLSIGSTDPLDMGYLKELRALRDRVKARRVSDHLCWTGVAGKNTHDLLPVPYTEEALEHLVARVKRVQDFLGAPLALENPSTYAELSGASMREWEFLGRLSERSDCAILLDVNNVYVSANNHGFDPLEYLGAIPFERVVQLHVAGHTDHGTHIIDSYIPSARSGVSSSSAPWPRSSIHFRAAIRSLLLFRASKPCSRASTKAMRHER